MSQTTELEAVNIMLSAIASGPVTTLSGQISADASMARNILKEVQKTVLSRGWSWNTDTKVPLEPNATTGRIPAPPKALSVDTTAGYNPQVVLQHRGGQLYDSRGRTYTFTDTLYCDVIWLLDWDEIPEAARYYIAVRAARILADRVDRDINIHAFSKEDEQLALGELKRHESKVGDRTIFDSWPAGRIINRGNALRGMRR